MLSVILSHLELLTYGEIELRPLSYTGDERGYKYRRPYAAEWIPSDIDEPNM